MNKPNRRADHTSGHRAVFDKNKLKLIRIGKANGACCAICGQAIDFKIKYPDPLSATVDHIIPISKGGHPSSIENLQLAHMICNVSKSNKIVQKSAESGEKNAKKDVILMDDLPLSYDWFSYRAK